MSLNEIVSVFLSYLCGSELINWINQGLLLGFERTKGREWLERNSGSNSQRGQVNAAFDGLRIYDEGDNGNFFQGEGVISKLPVR